MTVKKSDVLKGKILKIVLSSEQPLSTQDIATQLSKPWHSVQMRCLRLQIEKELNGFRVGRINLWQSL